MAKWMAAVRKKMQKAGTVGALREQMGAAEGKNIPTSELRAKASELSKKAKGEKKLSASELEKSRRVNLALRFRGK